MSVDEKDQSPHNMLLENSEPARLLFRHFTHLTDLTGTGMHRT